MSYQSFLRSTSNPVQKTSTPSPASSVHRKPPPNYTASLRSASSVHNSVTQNTPSNTNSLATSTPLSSYPPPVAVSPSPAPKLQGINADPPPIATSAIAAPPSSVIKPLTKQEIDTALQACLALQDTAVTQHEKRPFAALLLGPDNVTILNTYFSISHIQHAESELARLASVHYSQTYLAKCTLVSTWEPCAMCAGALYWSGIGRLVYAAPESKLRDLTGAGNSENMTMNLPCRTVLNAGQRNIEVVGPVSVWEEKVVEESGKWWKEHQKETDEKSVKENGSIAGKTSIITAYTEPEESILSSIGEDGEYKADLKIDWMS